MLKKRIIPCLDIKDGRTVKGINFLDIQDVGDPIALAKKYVNQGADELVFLDITATVNNKKTLLELVRKMAAEINIPFTVGGGISSVGDVRNLLMAGADKISINSAAVKRPELITEISNAFGSQCTVVAVDTKLENDEWNVFTHGGRLSAKMKTINWVKQIENLGGGEILLTSMNNDGTKNGFAIDITKDVANTVNIPIIASGGAGHKEHFKEVFEETTATGALAASVFHYGTLEIPNLKKYLIQQQIPIRL